MKTLITWKIHYQRMLYILEAGEKGSQKGSQ